MSRGILLKTVIFILSGFPLAFAQGNPAERASELKVWQQQCKDPDYDLRLAYIEQAIATGDTSVQRICIRAALESDNTDIRNLGLRAAVASLERIYFKVEKPLELTAAEKKAEKNEDEIKKIKGWRVSSFFEGLKSGFSYQIVNASIAGGHSEWFSITSNTNRDNNSAKGNADIVSDEIKWVGKLLLSNAYRSCRLNVRLSNGEMLEGTLQCEDEWLFPVSAKLF